MDELIEPEKSTRRGLLRAFAQSAARHTRDGAGALGADRLDPLLTLDESSPGAAARAAAPGATAMPPRRPARRPEHVASFDELVALAHAEGLRYRDDELRRLATPSLRMTAVQPVHADAWILTSEDWSTAGHEVLLAVVKLGPATTQDCQLPSMGWLALLVDASDSTEESNMRRARGIVSDVPAAISNAAEPVALSPELVLPRRWHEMVQALALDDTEAHAYDRLRTRAQLLQGVESDDDGGPDIAYHRLFGYPNETTGTMPLDCVRALRDSSAAEALGLDVVDPVLPSYQWRLLTQISGGARRRTYVWIRQTDLDTGEFGELCAFVR
jgi:hypothetical protein